MHMSPLLRSIVLVVVLSLTLAGLASALAVGEKAPTLP